MDERFLFVAPENIKIAVSPHFLVGVLLDYENEMLGLAPGVKLAVELTPSEARDLAAKLLRKASEAEVKSQQH